MRSAYSCDMRFFPDQPERLVGVTWYQVPDDRPFVPWPHAFGTRVWEYQDDDDPPYGELNKPRPWRGGQAPATAGDGGICGTPEQWLDGCEPDAEIPPPWPGGVVCSKCKRPALRFKGGAGSGGETAAPGSCCRSILGAETLWAEYIGPTVYANLAPGDVKELHRVLIVCTPSTSEPPLFASDPFDWGDQFGHLEFFCTANFVGAPLPYLLGWTDCVNFFYQAIEFTAKVCDPFSSTTGFEIGPPPEVPISAAKWRVTLAHP